MFPAPEVRIRVAPDRFRVADFVVYAHSRPTEAVPSQTPLVVAEIVSPDDTYPEIKAKLADYHALGVPHIWLLDPATRTMESSPETASSK